MAHSKYQRKFCGVSVFLFSIFRLPLVIASPGGLYGLEESIVQRKSRMRPGSTGGLAGQLAAGQLPGCALWRALRAGCSACAPSTKPALSLAYCSCHNHIIRLGHHSETIHAATQSKFDSFRDLSCAFVDDLFLHLYQSHKA